MIHRFRLLICTSFVTSAMGLYSVPSYAQAIDLSHGGQITVTSLGGFDWDQKNQTVTAYESAQAVRGDVTVTADRLIAFYRKKPGSVPAKNTDGEKKTALPGEDGGGSNEVYRLEAIGHVHIFTNTDQAWGDKAVYDIDQATLVMTGKNLKMTTPQDVLTARDAMEYHSATRMSVGRGDATVTTKDGRRIRADVLVGYSAPGDSPPKGAAEPAQKSNDPLKSGSGKLEKVHAFGHVLIRTQTETVTGDRGVYMPNTGLGHIVGNVHITRGPNQISGAAAVVDTHTGLAHMTQVPGSRVQGLVVPNENNNNKN